RRRQHRQRALGRARPVEALRDRRRPTRRMGDGRSERDAAPRHQPVEQLPYARSRDAGDHPHRRALGLLVPEPALRPHRAVRMNAAYVGGRRIAVRQWQMCLVLFAASVAAALCFSAATWIWLSGALDAALPTRTLLSNLDMDVFVDLFTHHSDSLE